ncbi:MULTISPECIES: hypothetical protein [Pseudomonas]|uniref:Uncharacterized protein n=1 Tax=Pseudomonas fluorescens TaxID=294 RepID=A0A166MTP6_PSEFL|nr:MULTISPECIES: hypothetical protein [Pseudomonas]KZN16201.1 hypothetical protein A1D17_08540 [Pseudomonas fluorescens]
MSAKLQLLQRRMNSSTPEKNPVEPASDDLAATIERLVQERVREELAKQPKLPAPVQRIVARPKPETLDPAVERGLNQAVRDGIAIALQERQAILDAQLDRQQQALDMQLDMQRQQHAQQLDMQRQQHAQQMDMQRQFEAPAPVQTTPVQKPKPMQATIERDGAGLIRAMVVNGQRFLAQRDGAGKLIGIASEGV